MILYVGKAEDSVVLRHADVHSHAKRHDLDGHVRPVRHGNESSNLGTPQFFITYRPLYYGLIQDERQLRGVRLSQELLTCHPDFDSCFGHLWRKTASRLLAAARMASSILVDSSSRIILCLEQPGYQQGFVLTYDRRVRLVFEV